jgi:hypothetical protein
MITKLRNIRIPDHLWEPAKVAADARHTTVSAVIRTHLEMWLDAIAKAEAIQQHYEEGAAK